MQLGFFSSSQKHAPGGSRNLRPPKPPQCPVTRSGWPSGGRGGDRAALCPLAPRSGTGMIPGCACHCHTAWHGHLVRQAGNVPCVLGRKPNSVWRSPSGLKGCLQGGKEGRTAKSSHRCPRGTKPVPSQVPPSPAAPGKGTGSPGCASAGDTGRTHHGGHRERMPGLQ